MQQYIGGTGVMTWVERIISPGRHIQKARELKSFTVKGNISGSRPDMITGKSEGPGLPARELTHVNKKTRPLQVSQVQTVKRKDEPESTRPVSPDSDAEKPSMGTVQSLPVSAGRQENREQTRSDEQVTRRASPDNKAEAQSQIDVIKVAEKVYRLMQRDLIVENERATKIGG